MKKRKKYVYRESQEQSAFFDWLDIAPEMKIIKEVSFAIPNARRSSWFMGKTLKREGVRAGVPDVFIAWPTDFYPGLFIEHKAKDGKITPAQKKRMKSLTEAGYKCVVSYSSDESIKTLKEYAAYDSGAMNKIRILKRL